MKSIKPQIPYYGGKRKIAPMVAKVIRSQLTEESTYYEPFVGGGAVFLELEYPNSVIGDIVPELINMYECIRDDWKEIAFYYNKMENSQERYYQIRNFDRNPHFATRNRFFKAARYIYLCKLGFGSCRWNLHGQANQSYFRHPERPCILNEIDLMRTSELLQTTRIKRQSFDETLETVKKGDVVYLDPPYIDTKYDQYWIDKFKESNMEILKTHCDELDRKGAKFILSHSGNEKVCQLYQEYEIISLRTCHHIKWQRSYTSKLDDEILITNIRNVEELLDEDLASETELIA